MPFSRLTLLAKGEMTSPPAPYSFSVWFTWHSPLSQYAQLGVAVQLAPGFAAQNVAEQSLPGAGGGGVGGEGAAQSDGKGTLKV